jgi:hypothetical protein
MFQVSIYLNWSLMFNGNFVIVNGLVNLGIELYVLVFD